MRKPVRPWLGAAGVALLAVAVLQFGPSAAWEIHRVDASAEGFTFEWAARETDSAYLLQVDPGDNGVCEGEQSTEGRLTHESGMGHYTFMGFDQGWIQGMVSRRDDSVHIGSANTAHVTGPLWATVANAAYGVEWFGSTEVGWRSMLAAAFEVEAPLDQPLRVECQGDGAALRFYRADAFEPIYLTTATGGAGLYLGAAPGFSAGVNIADRYVLETEGSVVVLRLFDWEAPSRLGPSQIKGEVIIRSPLGVEHVPLVPDFYGHVWVERVWEEPGVYELEFNVVSMNRDLLKGLFAGFVLETELG